MVSDNFYDGTNAEQMDTPTSGHATSEADQCHDKR